MQISRGGMIRPLLRTLAQAHLHDLVTDHAGGGCLLLKAGAIFQHVVDTVVPHPADITASGGLDVIPQGELRVPAVHHVGVARREIAAQYALLVALAGVLGRGDLPGPGHVMVHVKL